MTRPSDVHDPLSPDAPVRVDDPRIDRLRSRMTLEGLLREPGALEYARRPVEYVDEEPPDIPPDRLAWLRERRDELIALLRERRDDDGE
jgi:hypothetical protein